MTTSSLCPGCKCALKCGSLTHWIPRYALTCISIYRKLYPHVWFRPSSPSSPFSFEGRVLQLNKWHFFLRSPPWACYHLAGADLPILYTDSSLAGPELVPDYAVLNATISGFRGLLWPFIGSVLVSIGWHFKADYALSTGLIFTRADAVAFILKSHTTVLMW